MTAVSSAACQLPRLVHFRYRSEAPALAAAPFGRPEYLGLKAPTVSSHETVSTAVRSAFSLRAAAGMNARVGARPTLALRSALEDPSKPPWGQQEQLAGEIGARVDAADERAELGGGQALEHDEQDVRLRPSRACLRWARPELLLVRREWRQHQDFAPMISRPADGWTPNDNGDRCSARPRRVMVRDRWRSGWVAALAELHAALPVPREIDRRVWPPRSS